MSDVHPLLEIPSDAKLGPAMKSLNMRQQAFVIAMIEMGGINHTRAALAAGYGNGTSESAAVTAHRLAHDEQILQAIHEEAHRRLRSGAIMAVQTLLEIANSQAAENKDRLKAVEMMLNRTGLHAVTEHNVKVERIDESNTAKIEKVKLLAGKLGLDPAKLLGNIVDAEFMEVKPEVLQVEDGSVTSEDDLADIF